MKRFATAGLMAGQINLMMNHGYKSLLHGEQEVYGQKRIPIMLNDLHRLEK